MEEITKLIDELQPQAARYDTPIADDLVLCTFPNGVKTWIFVCTSDGVERRRSIGVYPEMTLADARQALVAVRKLQRVEDTLAEQGLEADERPARSEALMKAAVPVQAARRWLEKRTIGAAIAGGLMSIAILLGVRQLPYEFFFDSPSMASDATPAAQEAAATAPASTVTPVAASPSAAEGAPAVAAVAPAGETVAAEPAPGAEEPGAPTAAGQTPVVLSPANQALLEAQDKLRGSVAREILARGMENEQPVDRFEAKLAIEPNAAMTVYYFTWVRGMAGRTILHQWLHEGVLVSEVALNVGEGWLSALHSSATLTPEMTGHWEVRICDASGKALEQEHFELTPTTQLSSR